MSTIGFIRGDTRSVDYGLYRDIQGLGSMYPSVTGRNSGVLLYIDSVAMVWVHRV